MAKLSELTDSDAVLQAISEFERRGRDEFLAEYGFGRSKSYFLVYEGERYDSKAIVGVAWKYQFGEQLRPEHFSGGEKTVRRCLARLGFSVEKTAGTESGTDGTEARRQGRTWIFQGNPDVFDVDGYLAAKLPRITWTVRQNADRVAPGDRVYLWRAAGRKKAVAGIIARAVVDSPIWSGPDHDEARPFWKGDPSASQQTEKRVWLRVERVASKKKEVVKRAWLKDDPICSDLLILRQAAGTNYRVEDRHRRRLDRLWARTGVDWDRPDSVAGLWAYDQTYGGPLSKAVSSPVADVAIRIGRSVGGVYNKVLNYRAIDPRDTRSGLSGGGAMDRSVWAEFYDTKKKRVRTTDLEAAFLEFWSTGKCPVSRGEPAIPPPTTTYSPTRRTSTVTRVVRDSAVAAWVKKIHDYTCQICGTRLVTPRGAYAEGAHIRPLGAEHQGSDGPENILCLCPNHHVQFDAGAFTISDDLLVVDVARCGVAGRLRIAEEHVIELANLRYHRDLIAGRSTS